MPKWIFAFLALVVAGAIIHAWTFADCRVMLFGLVLVTKSPLAIAAFALLFGATFWVTAPLTVVFVRRTYGTALLGTVAGMVTMVHHSLGGVGAYVGAASFDATGSYDSAFWVMLLTSMLCIALVHWYKQSCIDLETTPGGKA